MPVSSKLHVATGRAKPLLKLAGKLVLLTALRYVQPAWQGGS